MSGSRTNSHPPGFGRQEVDQTPGSMNIHRGIGDSFNTATSSCEYTGKLLDWFNNEGSDTLQRAFQEIQQMVDTKKQEEMSGLQNPSQNVTGTGTPKNNSDSDERIRLIFQHISRFIERNDPHGGPLNPQDRVSLNTLYQYIYSLRNERDQLQNNLSEQKAVNLELVEKYKNEKETLAADEFLSGSKNYKQLRKAFEQMKDERSNIVAKYKEIEEQNKNLVDQKNELMQNLNEERLAKERALSRLSSEYGEKLYKDNTSIVDLSDPKRPEKIAEKFSEIYDKEWTETLEKFTDASNMSEEKIIENLRTLLVNCYTFCSTAAETQLSLIKVALLYPDGNEEVEQEGSYGQRSAGGLMKKIADIPDFFKKAFNSRDQQETSEQQINSLCKEIRKSMAAKSVPMIYEKFLNKELELYPEKHRMRVKEILKAYSEKCVDICWSMCIQSPAVVFDTTTSEGSRMDSSEYRSYTQNGDRIQFIVWPAMHQYENGPIIMKGIAQPYKSASKSLSHSTRTPYSVVADPAHQSSRSQSTPSTRSQVTTQDPLFSISSMTDSSGNYVMTSDSTSLVNQATVYTNASSTQPTYSQSYYRYKHY